MATTEAVLRPAAKPRPLQAGASFGALICTALTPVAVVIHGYHPYAEDGGVYLAGVKRTLDPELYPAYSGFVTAHLHLSIFARLIAFLVHTTRCPVMVAMFAVYVTTVWLILFAGWSIVARCTRSIEGRAGAVVLLALMLTVPIAGTSLMLMDPYVTARSISTPCALLAIVGALDFVSALRERSADTWKGLFLCCSMLSFCLAVHPLMGVYAFGCVVLQVCFGFSDNRLRWGIVLGLCLFAVMFAGCIEWFAHSASNEYRGVALTRDYWFIWNWHWYELFGLIAPLTVLYLCGNWIQAKAKEGANLANMCATAGATAIVIAMLFSRVNSTSFMVARLQPLRIFHTIYILMILALGALLGIHVLRKAIWRWGVLIVVLGTGMGAVQLEVFPHSNHLEFPWRVPMNGWEQAFNWIRTHTPRDAVFAMDSRYAIQNGEDTQNFRAIAERSALPDYAKDGGVASIVPVLASQWNQAVQAQSNVAGADIQQLQLLNALGANWILLPSNTRSALECPFRNVAVSVCILPDRSNSLPIRRWHATSPIPRNP